MSMPRFPEEGIYITREQALNMLLGSIAMEELGLSHIINAEGEKLQYILGTLPCATGLRPTTQELLEVNQSVSILLEHVAHNQFLLKGKLTQILQAQEHLCPAPPPRECGQTDLFCAYQEGLWCVGQSFPWKRTCPCPDCGAHSCAISAIHPGGTGACLINFFFELLPADCGQVTIALSSLRGGVSTLISKSSAYAPTPHAPIYVSGSTVLAPQPGEGEPSLFFSLCQPQRVQVKRARLALTCLGDGSS